MASNPRAGNMHQEYHPFLTGRDTLLSMRMFLLTTAHLSAIFSLEDKPFVGLRKREKVSRSVNAHAYAQKRNAILDAAQRSITTKGYEQMTTQDLLQELQISRGALYHYFESKQALPMALVER